MPARMHSRPESTNVRWRWAPHPPVSEHVRLWRFATRRVPCETQSSEGTDLTEAGERDQVQNLDAGALQAWITKGNPVLVDIWARWCGRQAMLPVLDAMLPTGRTGSASPNSRSIMPGLRQNGLWTRQFGLRSVPKFIPFKRGAEIAGLAGTAMHSEMDDSLKE
jgi:hypothetical protein